MWNLVILILLTIFLYIFLKRRLKINFLKAEFQQQQLKDKYTELRAENEKLKLENSLLEKTTQETIELYDITKQICKSLNDSEVFHNFSEQLNRCIEIGECKFVKRETDLSLHDKSEVLPLKLDRQTIGYLVAVDVKDEDKEKFHILSQQFLLGIKRALLYQRVQELAIIDSLTGVFSRRYLIERFNEELERSKKFKYKFSFLMLDIDHFKAHNDRYGHLVGDAILKEVSKTFKENMRQIDLAGRYGGEEFSIILSETDKDGAGLAAERLRQAVENKHIRIYDEDLQVTISIGVSVFPEDAKDIQTLIEKADEALYQAKQSGRNRVCFCN